MLANRYLGLHWQGICETLRRHARNRGRSNLSRTEPTTEEALRFGSERDRELAPPGGAGGGEALATQEPEREEVDLREARSLLTELRPAGFGEVLVTDVWMPPAAGDGAAEDESRDRQREWDGRQELRQLNLLRERPTLSYDARYEQYWGQVHETLGKAPQAIMDPYTLFVAAFADADVDGIAEHRANAREYGRESRSLLELGRAYVAIGRLKSARSTFESAAKADPLDADVWWHLGVSRLLGRANAAATRAFERAVDQVPGDFRSGLALATARYHMKDYAAAEERFRRLAGSTGLEATARSMLACSLRMQGKWDAARVRAWHPARRWWARLDRALRPVSRLRRARGAEASRPAARAAAGGADVESAGSRRSRRRLDRLRGGQGPVPGGGPLGHHSAVHTRGAPLQDASGNLRPRARRRIRERRAGASLLAGHHVDAAAPE